jgi:hypothetical protein
MTSTLDCLAYREIAVSATVGAAASDEKFEQGKVRMKLKELILAEAESHLRGWEPDCKRGKGEEEGEKEAELEGKGEDSEESASGRAANGEWASWRAGRGREGENRKAGKWEGKRSRRESEGVGPGRREEEGLFHDVRVDVERKSSTNLWMF